MRRRKKAKPERRGVSLKAKLAMIVAACAMLALAGLAYGGYSLKRWVVSLEVFTVKRAVIADAPDWLPAAVKSDLLRFCPVGEGTSIFDPKMLSKIKSSYLVNGWVKEVEWVGRRFPDTVQCKLQLRRPCAAVEMKRFYLVDWDGVRPVFLCKNVCFASAPHMRHAPSPILSKMFLQISSEPFVLPSARL